jgi:excisionase family DNA binding protein
MCHNLSNMCHNVSMDTNIKTTTEQPAKLGYSINQTIRATGLSRRTVWRLLASGKLTCVRVGRHTIIHAGSLKALLQIKQ